jgi:hypothetical protein
MVKEEKLERYEAIFSSLSENSQDYILAIQQALLFAQNGAKAPPPGNDDPLARKGA